MDTGTRTGISYLANDGSDAVTAYRTSIRNIVAFLEASEAPLTQGLLASRPAAGTARRWYKPTDTGLESTIYYDDGSTWQSIGAAAAIDAAAGVGSLRTLGAGSLQAAAGNHTHAIGAITGAGDAAAKNTGTSSGTVAAGDHTHSAGTITGAVGVSYVTKGSDTAKGADTTIADDPDLQLALGTGTYHVVVLLGMVAPNQTGDIQTSLTFTGTSTVKIHGRFGMAAAGTTSVTGGNPLVSPASFGPTTTTYGVDGTATASFLHEQMIVVVTGSGTFKVQWAQAVANSGGLTMKAGSSIVAYKIA